MGVRGLSGYVDRSNILEPITITPWQPRKFVIDGTSLSYHINEGKIDWRVGQYSKFSKDLVAFIQNLQQCGVTIEAVVFDSGRGHPIKRNTRINRDTKSISILQKNFTHRCVSPYIKLNAEYPSTGVLPGLTHFIAIHTLKSLNLKVVIAKEEADKVLAAYAKATSSILLGNDSDFMIFPLEEGYIPLKTVTFISSTIHALHFCQERFSRHLGLPKQLFPLLPCFLGCDYLSYDILRDNLYFSTRGNGQRVFDSVLGLLAGFKHASDLTSALNIYFNHFNLQPKDQIRLLLEALFQEVLKEYTLDEGILEAPMTPHPNDPNGLLTDPMCFKVFFCFPQIEDFTCPTVWTLSKPLRSLAYKRWLGPECIQEYQREETAFTMMEVYPTSTSSIETHLLQYPSLLQRAVRYLIELRCVSMKDILAIALAVHAPVREPPSTLYAPPSSSYLLSLLETTMVSGAMLWSMPIHVDDVVDGPSLFVYLEKLWALKGSIQQTLSQFLVPELVEKVTLYIKSMFTKPPRLFFEKNADWIYDI